jgi:transcription antitermination factor NusA-like protein
LPNFIKRVRGLRVQRREKKKRKLTLFIEKQCTTALKEIFYKRIDLFLDNILEILYLYNIPGIRIVLIVALKNVLNY